MATINEYVEIVAKLGNELGIQPINSSLALRMNSLAELYKTLDLMATKEYEEALANWYDVRGRGDPATYGNQFVFIPKLMWDGHYGVDSIAQTKVLERLSFTTTVDEVRYDFHVDRNGRLIIRVTVSANELCIYLMLDFLHLTFNLLSISESLSANPQWLVLLWKLDSTVLGNRIRSVVSAKVLDDSIFMTSEHIWFMKVMATMPEGLRALDKYDQALAAEIDWGNS